MALAAAFLATRGAGPEAPWHVRELTTPFIAPVKPDPRLPDPARPLPYGEVAGGSHVAVPNGAMTPALAATLLNQPRDLVITPWHGVLVPQEGS